MSRRFKLRQVALKGANRDEQLSRHFSSDATSIRQRRRALPWISRKSSTTRRVGFMKSTISSGSSAGIWNVKFNPHDWRQNIVLIVVDCAETNIRVTFKSIQNLDQF